MVKTKKVLITIFLLGLVCGCHNTNPNSEFYSKIPSEENSTGIVESSVIDNSSIIDSLLSIEESSTVLESSSNQELSSENNSSDDGWLPDIKPN